MKLDELLVEKKEKQKGTYAGVKFSKDTVDGIKEYIKENDIPNHTDYDKMHTTLLYSRKYLTAYEPSGKLSDIMVGNPIKFDVWDTQPDDGGNVARCLVLTYKCADLVRRHEYLMKEHGATFDYDDYTPHVTFSYDIGDMKDADLPKFDGKIEIVEEYGEDLNLDWAQENSDKSEKKDK